MSKRRRDEVKQDREAVEQLLAEVGRIDPSGRSRRAELPRRRTEREAVERSAVRHKITGKVWTDTIENGPPILAAAGVTDEQRRLLTGTAINQIVSSIYESDEYEIGFMTDHERFVDGERAFRVAWNARQLAWHGQMPALGEDGELAWLPEGAN